MSVTTDTTIFDIERQVADDLGGGEYAWKCLIGGTVPLPDGAATAAKQDEQTAILTDIEANTASLAAEDFATETTLAALNAKVTTVDTDDVTITSSVLPTGAATEAKQDAGNASLVSIDAKLTNPLPVSGTVTASLSAAPPSRAVTTAYATSLVVKASAGNLYTLTGYNSKTTSQFIQVHNTTSVPADTAIPIYTFLVSPSSNFSLDFSVYPEAFSTGITVCNSSTGPTKTIGSADCWFTARYV